MAIFLSLGPLTGQSSYATRPRVMLEGPLMAIRIRSLRSSFRRMTSFIASATIDKDGPAVEWVNKSRLCHS
jgi:hypothetical protein